jgi:sugar phosphate isomerase/epimerase
MTALSRREFGRLVMLGSAAAPFAALPGRVGATAAGQIPLGVSTSSFHDLPRVTGTHNLDAVIGALGKVGAKHVELAFANVEPAPPSMGPFLGGTAAYPRRVVLTPEQMAATSRFYRTALRKWRSAVSLADVEQMGAKLAAAGLTVHACAIAYDDSFTDDEIESTFLQARTLGADVVSSPLSLAMARRLAPFAERHRIAVAIHNQADGPAAGAIATADLGAALALSSRFALKLDIGNLTASNADAVAVLREHHGRVSYVLVKDRLRNGGASQHFGEGDTPIPAVLNALKGGAVSVPAIVEYDYVGLRSSVEEVTAAMAYLTRALG